MTPSGTTPLLTDALTRHRAGQLEEAERGYRRVLARHPRDAAALRLLGVLCHQTGRAAEAVPLLVRAVAADPDNGELRGVLGVALRRMGRAEEAVSALRHAAALLPGSAEVRVNLGNALADLGRHAEALDCHQDAIRLDPRLAEAHCGLGNALLDQGRAEAALAPLRAALALRPDFAAAWNSLGTAWFELRDLDQAAACFQAALRAAPGFAEALGNLGAVRYEAGDQDGAADSLRRTIALAPNDADAHFHLAQTLLRQGDYAAGFAEYEWRRRKPGFPRPAFPQPEWTGEALEGRTILLYAEQGLGDTLQFCRFAPLVAARGGKVVLAVPPPLVRLLSGLAGVERAVASATGTPLPPFDCHLPLMSAPYILGTRLESLPAGIPYLRADPAAAARWRERLAGRPGFRVGLVWAGAPRPHDRQSFLTDRRRSLALANFAPLAAIPSLRLISLQKGPPAAELASPPPGLVLEDWMGEIEDFADTAALIANLDLVVSVDTSTAHLAGAMGRPVWLLSRHDGCWRWLLDREDSPWYPSLRLFRQTAPGAWGDAIARLGAELAVLATGSTFS